MFGSSSKKAPVDTKVVRSVVDGLKAIYANKVRPLEEV